MKIEKENKLLLVEKQVQDFLNTSDLSIEEIEIALKNIKQQQNMADNVKSNLKAVLELDKMDVVRLILGTDLHSYSFLDKFQKEGYGRWTGGHVDKRTRNEIGLRNKSIEELLELYKIIK